MVTTTNLLGYWKCDDSSGSMVDAHASYDGDANGTPTYSQTGIINDSIYFSGNDSFDTYGFSSTTQDYTFQFWCKSSYTAVAFGDYLIDIESGRLNMKLCSGTGGDAKNQIGYYDGSHSNLATNPCTDGAWHHLVFTFDSGSTTGSLYIDGAAPVTDDYSVLNLGGAIAIGSAYPGTPAFLIEADLDEIAIWDRVLTSDEIRTDLYNGGSGLAYPFTVGGTNTQVNIGDTWKDVPKIQVNIGDTWKDVAGLQINIGDSWKGVF